MDLSFDSLLGMDFLRQTSFDLNFKSMTLLNPEADSSISLSFITRVNSCEMKNVILPADKAFPFEEFTHNFSGRSAAENLSNEQKKCDLSPFAITKKFSTNDTEASTTNDPGPFHEPVHDSSDTMNYDSLLESKKTI